MPDLTYHDLEIIIRRLKREIKKLEREVKDLKTKPPRRRGKKTQIFAPSRTPDRLKFI